MKFSGIDASGQRSALAITGKSVRIFTDRIVIGDEVLLRNWTTFGTVDGKSAFAEVVVEEEETPPEPKQMKPAEKGAVARAEANFTAENVKAAAEAARKK